VVGSEAGARPITMLHFDPRSNPVSVSAFPAIWMALPWYYLGRFTLLTLKSRRLIPSRGDGPKYTSASEMARENHSLFSLLPVSGSPLFTHPFFSPPTSACCLPTNWPSVLGVLEFRTFARAFVTAPCCHVLLAALFLPPLHF